MLHLVHINQGVAQLLNVVHDCVSIEACSNIISSQFNNNNSWLYIGKPRG